MTYYKPKDLSYSDLCIWCDNNAYKPDCDINRLYEYLYLIAVMLAKHHKFFKHSYLYDRFGLYIATRMYLRLFNPKQYELKEDGTPKMVKLKSVLNYMRAMLFGAKCDFEQLEYTQILSKEEESSDVCIISDIDTTIQDSLNDIENCEFNIYLETLPLTVKKFIDKLKFKFNNVELNNIYLSCILTLLNHITINNRDKERLARTRSVSLEQLEYIYKLESKEPILFHLDKSLAPLVNVLVNELKQLIAKELCYKTKTNITSKNNIKNILLSSLTEEEYDD